MTWDWPTLAAIATVIGLLCGGCWTIIKLYTWNLTSRINKNTKDIEDLALKFVTREEFNLVRDNMRETREAIAQLGNNLSLRLDNILNNMMSKGN